ncbi:MAG: hypothetical protein KIT14_11505 [bacterium]|nr:hypothetical protein [bacterium]
MSNRGLFVVGVAFVAFCAAVMLLPRRTIRDTERRGSVVARTADGTPVVVTLLQREVDEIVIRGGLRSIPRIASVTWYEPILVAHDARSGAARWTRTLERIDAHDVQEQSRILAADGDRVWLFAAGILGVDAASGETVVDAAALEATNPALRDVLPREGRWFEVERKTRKLLVTAADGRLWRVDARPLAVTPATKAAPHTIAGDYLRGLQQWSAGPAIGHAPHDYTLQGDLLETQWVGLLAPEEKSRFEGQLSQPLRPSNDPPRRRRLWYADASARNGITGVTWSSRDLAPADESAEFLQGGLLRDGGYLRVLRPKAPDGFLVLHTDRLGDGGQYLLSRVDTRGRPRWTAALPLRRIADLIPGDDVLVLLGPDRTAEHPGDAHELLVTLDLATGRCRTWDFFADAALETACTPTGG